jgi:hypothetical protein
MALTQSSSEYYFTPAGTLECVAPAGGVNWAAAQEGAEATFFHVFFTVFSCFFSLVGFCDFYLLSAFSEFIEILIFLCLNIF